MSRKYQLLSDKQDKVINRFNEFKKDNPYPVITLSELSTLAGYITNSVPGLRSVPYDILVTFLLKDKLIEEAKIKGVDLFKYHDSKIDVLDIAHSFFRKNHFSYHSALYINKIILKIPETIYLDYERTKLYPSENKLLQLNIDQAFSKAPRKSSNVTEIPKYKILYIQSKNYNKIGVVSFRAVYTVTDLERTLIDATVRPFYAGGIVEVLNSYKKAKGRLDVLKLYKYYKVMGFTYPYHQAIGFYLQKAGYCEEEYELFKTLKMEFDFYLTYNMPNKVYSDKWRLYYPEDF